MELDLGIFWDNLTTLGKIYWTIAIPATFIYIISFIIWLINKESDNNDIDGIDDEVNFLEYFINFKTFMSFFTISAWIGIICINKDLSISLIIVISLISGLLMMLFFSYILFLFDKIKHNKTLQLNKILGMEGLVYLTIPAKRKSNGKIQVKLQGEIITIDAKTDEDDQIVSNTKIIIIDFLENNEILVKTKK